MRTSEAHSERGATMLEFLVMAPLYILFLFMLLDLARYFSAQVILTHGAQVGLRSAECREDLEFDPFLSSEEEYRAMRKARVEIAKEATALPLLLLKWVVGGSELERLQHFRHVSANADEKEPSELLPALILLPGESALAPPAHEVEDKIVSKKVPWVDYPGLCAEQSTSCHPSAKRKSSRTFPEQYSIVQLVRGLPIIVELRSTFRFLMPGLPTLTLKGRAVGYRERFPRFPEPGK